MIVLITHEESQTVTKFFRERGHEAYSCDILPTEGNPEWHIQEDVLRVFETSTFIACNKEEYQAIWDLMIAFPPCPYLTVSANKHYKIKCYNVKIIVVVII